MPVCGSRCAMTAGTSPMLLSHAASWASVKSGRRRSLDQAQRSLRIFTHLGTEHSRIKSFSRKCSATVMRKRYWDVQVEPFARVDSPKMLACAAAAESYLLRPSLFWPVQCEMSLNLRVLQTPSSDIFVSCRGRTIIVAALLCICFVVYMRARRTVGRRGKVDRVAFKAAGRSITEELLPCCCWCCCPSIVRRYGRQKRRRPHRG